MFALILLMVKQHWKTALFIIHLCLAPMFAGLYVWRGHTIELLQVAQAKLVADQQLASATAAVKNKSIEAGYQAKLAEVNQNALIQIQAAYVAATNTRSSIIGLREQTAAAALKLPSAPQAAAVDYAITCGTILDAMAEAGGQISQKADGHAIDSERLSLAWPTDQ